MEKILKNAFNEENFEKLLVTNWTQFINSSKLMAYVIQITQENANNLIETSEPIKTTGVKISVSRFSLTPQKDFIIWVEFTLPISPNKMTEGTVELSLSQGNISHILTTGNIYSS